MNSYSEFEKSEMNDKVEQIETLAIKEIEKKTIDSIAALVNQAKIISEENNSLEKPYADLKNPPRLYIDETDKKKDEAREKYNDLMGMKKSHFWTIGRNKARVEKTQEVIIDIIDAVDNNANATKALFNNQIKMAEFSKKLYGIGLMGIASNRIVVREIKSRLEHASKEELTELARHELESVLSELMRQQRLENRVGLLESQLETKLNEAYTKCDQLAKHVDDNQNDVLARIAATDVAVKNSKEQLETKLNETDAKCGQLAKHVDDKQNNVLARIAATDAAVKSSKEQLETKLNENYKALISISDAYGKRLDLLEKKTFLDSSIYKVLVGIAALGALIISALNYFA